MSLDAGRIAASPVDTTGLLTGGAEHGSVLDPACHSIVLNRSVNRGRLVVLCHYMGR